jgi:hypothetical protein
MEARAHKPPAHRGKTYAPARPRRKPVEGNPPRRPEGIQPTPAVWGVHAGGPMKGLDGRGLEESDGGVRCLPATSLLGTAGLVLALWVFLAVVCWSLSLKPPPRCVLPPLPSLRPAARRW